MGPLAIAGAGLQAAGSIYGGIRGRKAAYAASNTQAGQAQENADIARRLAYEQNPYIFENAGQWGGHVADTANQAAGDITQAGQGAADLVTGTAAGAGDRVRSTADRASSLLDPYGAAGGTASQSLLDMAAGLNAPQEKFQFSEDDPSYQWRLQQGQQALERSAAGRGGLQSGATLKALTNYSQGAASQEYQAAFDRFMGQQKFGLDRTRLQADTLSGLATRGLTANTAQGGYLTDAEKLAGGWATTAANQAGGFTTDAAQTAGKFRTAGAEYQGNAMIDAQKRALANIWHGEELGMGLMSDRADALATGQVGGENAFTQGIAGAANAFGGMLSLADLYKMGPKAGRGGYGPAGPPPAGGGGYG